MHCPSLLLLITLSLPISAFADPTLPSDATLQSSVIRLASPRPAAPRAIRTVPPTGRKVFTIPEPAALALMGLALAALAWHRRRKQA
jgi:hypothetical protein